MILFQLLASWIWLQVFASAQLSQRKPALISQAPLKAKQGRSDGGNPIQ
jgi:hypothetical protein